MIASLVDITGDHLLIYSHMDPRFVTLSLSLGFWGGGCSKLNHENVHTVNICSPPPFSLLFLRVGGIRDLVRELYNVIYILYKGFSSLIIAFFSCSSSVRSFFIVLCPVVINHRRLPHFIRNLLEISWSIPPPSFQARSELYMLVFPITILFCMNYMGLIYDVESLSQGISN